MFTIYSKPSCPKCQFAKTLLEGLGETFVEYNILEPSNYDLMVDHVGYVPKTVPQIFEDAVFVGGYDELAIYMDRIENG